MFVAKMKYIINVGDIRNSRLIIQSYLKNVSYMKRVKVLFIRSVYFGWKFVRVVPWIYRYSRMYILWSSLCYLRSCIICYVLYTVCHSTISICYLPYNILLMSYAISHVILHRRAILRLRFVGACSEQKPWHECRTIWSILSIESLIL